MLFLTSPLLLCPGSVTVDAQKLKVESTVKMSAMWALDCQFVKGLYRKYTVAMIFPFPLVSLLAKMECSCSSFQYRLLQWLLQMALCSWETGARGQWKWPRERSVLNTESLDNDGLSFRTLFRYTSTTGTTAALTTALSICLRWLSTAYIWD